MGSYYYHTRRIAEVIVYQGWSQLFDSEIGAMKNPEYKASVMAHVERIRSELASSETDSRRTDTNENLKQLLTAA